MQRQRGAVGKTPQAAYRKRLMISNASSIGRPIGPSGSSGAISGSGSASTGSIADPMPLAASNWRTACSMSCRHSARSTVGSGSGSGNASTSKRSPFLSRNCSGCRPAVAIEVGAPNAVEIAAAGHRASTARGRHPAAPDRKLWLAAPRALEGGGIAVRRRQRTPIIPILGRNLPAATAIVSKARSRKARIVDGA